MKDFRSVLSDYLNKHDRHRKQFAAVVSLSMLVSFSVPMILTEPAVSMTQDSFSPVGDILSTQLFNASQGMVENYAKKDGNEVDGVVYSPKELAEGELLIGKGSDLYADSADAVIANAKREYFLGIASDFCIFLKTDFTPKAADAEGRVAVGGNVKYESNDGNYQIGAGDYISGTALKNTDNYEKASGFAQLIVGGSISQIAPYGTKHDDSGFSLASPEEDLYKRFVVSNNFNYDESLHIANVKWNNGPVADLVEYDNADGHNHYYNTYDDKFNATDEKAQIYQTISENPLIDFDAQFKWLNEQSSKLSKVKSIVGDPKNGILTFTAPDGIKEGDVVYFEIPEEWTDNKYEEIHYVNIPVDESNVPLCNIVVNCKGTTFNIGKNVGNGSGTIKTKINGAEISTGTEAQNNHKASEKILYNFYQATGECTFGCNFNGTILAPNADVKTKCDGPSDGAGHLSGALIANSYEGGMEFGYRPYRGPSSIVPSSSGYGVPIRKVISGSNTGLAGATFEITEGDEYSDTFTSDVNGEGYVNIPSAIDFSKEDYGDDHSEKHTYIIKEKNAPTGFILDDSKQYVVDVRETITEISTIDGRNIPTGVKTVMTSKTQKKNGENWDDVAGTEETFTIELNDIYSYNKENGTNSRVRRELKISQGNGTVEETFYMDIDGDGKVTKVMQASSDPLEEKLVVCTTGAEYDAVITTSYEADVPVYTSIDENSEIVTAISTSANDGFTLGYETVKVPKEKYKETFTFNKLLWNIDGNTPKISKMTVYYSDGSIDEVENACESLTTSNYWAEKTFEKPYENVVGVNVEFENANNTYIKLGFADNHSDITKCPMIDGNVTGSVNLKGVPDEDEILINEEDGSKLFITYDEKEVPMTQIILTTDTDYTTRTFDIGTSELDCYATLSPNGSGSNTTYTTVVDDVEKTYKYDEANIMLMPMPSEAPTFENDYGLIFTKHGISNGKDLGAVKGANIEIHTSDGDGKDCHKVKENVLEDGSSNTISLEGLDTNGATVYHFHEMKAPANYETAEPIYFTIDGTTVKYGNSANTLTEELNLENNNSEQKPFIQMNDIKKSGAKVKLEKIDGADKKLLKNSKFSLSVKKGSSEVLVCDELSIPDGTIDLFETFRGNQNVNSAYVKDGYLLPGTYVLKELTPPDGGYEAKTFEFEVKETKQADSNEIVYQLIPKEASKVGEDEYLPIDIEWTNTNGIANVTLNGNRLGNGNKIANVVSYKVKASGSNGNLHVYANNGGVIDNSKIGDKTTVSNTFDAMDLADLHIQIEPWQQGGWTVDEIIIKTSDGTSYRYGDGVESYTLNDVVWNAPKEDMPNIKQLILCYKDDKSVLYEDVQIKSDSDGGKNGDWWSLDLGDYNKNGVVGLRVVLEGEGEGKVVCQEQGSWGIVLGDKPNSNYYSAGTHDFGDVSALANCAKLESGSIDLDTSASYVKKEDGTSEWWWRTYTIDESNLLNSLKNKIPEGSKISKYEFTNNFGSNFTYGTQLDKWTQDNINNNQTVEVSTHFQLNKQVNQEYFALKAYWTNEIPVKLENLPTTGGDDENTSSLAGNAILKDDTTDTIQLENSKASSASISISKTWSDTEDYADITRPESITVTLKRKCNDAEDKTFKDSKEIEPTKDGKWEAKWDKLDQYKDNNENTPWLYYVEETPVTGYEVSYSKNNEGAASGIIDIKNTLETVDITLNKKWFESDGTTEITDQSSLPASIEVQVEYRKKGEEKWTPIEGDAGTITITKAKTWTETITGLPAMYEYRFAEVVPVGWDEISNDKTANTDDDDNSATLSNKQQVGSLGIEKNWTNDSATDRPDSLTISLYRTTDSPDSNAEDKDITVTEGEPIVLKTGDKGKLVLADSETTVEWINTENDKVKVEDGILTVLDEGTTTISATIDGTSTTFPVNVKIASIVPNMTGKPVNDIVLSADAWKATVDKLPIYSPDGKPYYYYIVEKYTSADNTVVVNGCTYYSVNYSDAVQLTDKNSTPTLSVTNEKVDTEGITLPEAGGNGTHNYYIAGICLIGMTGMFWFIRRRRTAK